MGNINQRTTSLKVKGVADIVFCFDCTGSMRPIIDGVKENVKNLVEGFKTADIEALDWRARVMGYRDFEVDDEYLINDRPFVSTEEELKNQIDGLEALKDSGGDDPESTLDAIWFAAKKSDWRSKCHKIVVLFTDDAPKPVNEKTLEEIEGADGDIELLSQELNVQHVKLFLWGKTDPAYDALKKIPRADIVQLDNPEEDFKSLDFGNLMNTIGKTISELVTSGVTE